MLTKKHIFTIPKEELTQVYTYFKKHTNIDCPNVPKKYVTAVTYAYDFLAEDLEIDIVIQSFDLSTIQEDRVILQNGEHFSGKMPGRILENSEKVICFVSSIKNFDAKSQLLNDSLESYFFDIWGTSFIENAQSWLKDYISNGLSELKLKRTHVWNPGQHQFELNNQRSIFKLLNPEDIGVQLSPSMKMMPIKSISGIMGVIKDDETNDLNPCDFCSLHKTCQVSKSTCS
ncbi:vitamin B12 dependent-methionine synthase activation domain-containing protein [Acetobacterium wieringae]|uniref:vitamin B12 dependent-methionine synthase activation domain-containing protein n=1 Tax=Acetobacterium wieringae TaxID=52694 RepID=UPI0026F2B7A3|nr:vitamin B12 dependent-methionine synthase activation domain-containing protein [Acetobacterium wieringae]